MPCFSLPTAHQPRTGLAADSAGLNQCGLQRTARGDQCQHFRSLFRDCYRVLRMSARLAVECHDRPAIRQNLSKMTALIHHRLHRKDVSGPDFWSQSRPAIIRNLRIFVHPPPDPMTDIITDNGIAVCFRVLLNRPTDVTQMIPGATLLDRTFERLFSDANQFEPFFVNLTNWNRRRRVTDKTFERGATVNRKNVAFLQNVIGRKAVHYLLIDGSTNRIGKTVVTFERREGAGVANHLLRLAIDLDRGHTWFDEATQLLQDQACKPASSAHFLQFPF